MNLNWPSRITEMTWDIIDPVGYVQIAASGDRYGRKNFSESTKLSEYNKLLTLFHR